MRMRKKKRGTERINACSDLITQNPTLSFPGSGPFGLEIGCGKGGFIIEMAKRNPDINFIAVERISDVVIIALERAKAENLPNLKFIICDALRLPEYFPPSSIRHIYLNFNDPWPKKGHAKRRLTYNTFLDIYKTLLVRDGKIHLKTDDRSYFDFSLEQFGQNGFSVENITYDLYESEFLNENIATEYETYFIEKGFKINRAEAYLL